MNKTIDADTLAYVRSVDDDLYRNYGVRLIQIRGDLKLVDPSFPDISHLKDDGIASGQAVNLIVDKLGLDNVAKFSDFDDASEFNRCRSALAAYVSCVPFSFVRGGNDYVGSYLIDLSDVENYSKGDVGLLKACSSLDGSTYFEFSKASDAFLSKLDDGSYSPRSVYIDDSSVNFVELSKSIDLDDCVSSLLTASVDSTYELSSMKR